MINYKKAMVDITNKCTLQCSQCERQLFNHTKDIPGGDTTLDQWNELTNYFSYIELTGSVGDPIFNPNLIEMLKIAKEKNVAIKIHTAASHKPMDWYQKAFDANTDAQWIFSIDGLPYQSFVYRTNQDGEYLFEVMKECRNKGLNPIWQYLVFSYNEDKIQDAIKLADEIDVEIAISYTGRVNDFLKPKDSKWEKNKEIDNDKFIPKCLNGQRYPYLSTEGQLLPCCWVDSPVMKAHARGEHVEEKLQWLLDKKFNLKNNNINDILNSEEYKNFYNDLTEGKNIPDYCKKKCSTSLVSPKRYRMKYRKGKLISEGEGI